MCPTVSQCALREQSVCVCDVYLYGRVPETPGKFVIKSSAASAFTGTTVIAATTSTEATTSTATTAEEGGREGVMMVINAESLSCL